MEKHCVFSAVFLNLTCWLQLRVFMCFLCCLIMQSSCINMSRKNDEKNDLNASVWVINVVFWQFGGNLLGKASVLPYFSSILKLLRQFVAPHMSIHLYVSTGSQQTCSVNAPSSIYGLNRSNNLEGQNMAKMPPLSPLYGLWQ